MDTDPESKILLRFHLALNLQGAVNSIHHTGKTRKCAVTNLFQPFTIVFLNQRLSIAVLPFINLSADPEQEYFC
ncbi:hypothetical protein ACFL4P_00870, partial [Gemmatimonadota bacterium]